MKELHLHLVSDSTGETVSSVARAALVQFEDVIAEEHLWTLVRTKGQLERVTSGIEKNPGIVLYTLVDENLIQSLGDFCASKSLPCVPVLNAVTGELVKYLGMKATPQAGKQHMLDGEYFKRVDAINFSLAHDDGQATWNLDEADIVLVGVSRTSKSPTSMYLAFRGYKCANVPFVSIASMPENMLELKKPMVVGLVIGSERLLDIRRSRLHAMKQNDNTDYVDEEKVEQEIAESRKIFSQQGWPVIDVTRRSVEETAAQIIRLYNDWSERKNSAKA